MNKLWRGCFSGGRLWREVGNGRSFHSILTSTKGRVPKGENPIVLIKDGPGGCSWRQGSVGELEAQVSVGCAQAGGV